MIARPATFIRFFESVMADTPLADRDDFDWGILALADPEEKWGAAWADLTAESEALEQQMTDALEAHRADCRARYGADFWEKNRG